MLWVSLEFCKASLIKCLVGLELIHTIHCSQHPAQPAWSSICSVDFLAAVVTCLTLERIAIPMSWCYQRWGLSQKYSGVTSELSVSHWISHSSSVFHNHPTNNCLNKRLSVIEAALHFMKQLHRLAHLVFTAHMRMWSKESFVILFYGWGNKYFQRLWLTYSHGVTKH